MQRFLLCNQMLLNCHDFSKKKDNVITLWKKIAKIQGIPPCGYYWGWNPRIYPKTVDPHIDPLDPPQGSTESSRKIFSPENFERYPCVDSILNSPHKDLDFYSVEWTFLYVLGN